MCLTVSFASVGRQTFEFLFEFAIFPNHTDKPCCEFTESEPARFCADTRPQTWFSESGLVAASNDDAVQLFVYGERVQYRRPVPQSDAISVEVQRALAQFRFDSLNRDHVLGRASVVIIGPKIRGAPSPYLDWI